MTGSVRSHTVSTPSGTSDSKASSIRSAYAVVPAFMAARAATFGEPSMNPMRSANTIREERLIRRECISETGYSLIPPVPSGIIVAVAPPRRSS